MTQRVWANYHAGRLLSDDGEARHEAFQEWEWGQRLPEKPAVCRALVRRVPSADAEAVIDLYQQCLNAGVVESTGLDVHLPYLIDTLIEQCELAQNPIMPLVACNVVAMLPPDTIDNQAIRVWEFAGRYPDPKGRRSAIDYATRALPAEHLPAAVAYFLDDADALVARHAWLLMAFLDPISGHSGNWREAPDGVAEAILYAAVATSDRPEFVLALVDSDPLITVRFRPVRRFLNIVGEPTHTGQAQPYGPNEQVSVGSFIEQYESQTRSSAEGMHWAVRKHFLGMLAAGLKDDSTAYDSLRVMLPECPLPPGPLSAEERSFAGSLFDAWWALHSVRYEFDLDAKVFRRKTNKAPE